MIFRRLVILFAALSSWAPAQIDAPAGPASPPATNPPGAPAATPQEVPAKPQIEKLDAFRYRIGAVVLEQKSREIRFPAKVNMAEGLLEYLLCQQQGKVHEALFVTEISPTHLNLAFTLLRYPASNELFFLTDGQPEASAAVKAAARIAIDVEWTADGKTQRVPVNEWIQHAVKTTAMAAGPWLYTGSNISEGRYIPDMTGDIVAIMGVPGAMINFPGPDNDDNVWFGYPKRVPPEGTPVTLIITPYSKPQPLTKP